MKKLCILIFLGAYSFLLSAQTDAHLWGICTRDSLLKAPHVVWFQKNYDDYQPNSAVVADLKKTAFRDFSLKIFLGTWCGDTKRELPRLLKTLDAVGFPSSNLTLIAVSSDDKFYKQSKNREETGYDIFRVATFIFEKKGVEVARIVETPMLSLERDLLAIFSNQPYQSNYFAYSTVQKWLKEDILADDNLPPSGIAQIVKPHLKSESDLNACGYVLMAQGKVREAVKIFRINCTLFPESANCYHSLAEGWLKKGEKDKALAMLEYGLKINKNPESVKSFLDLHKQIVQLP